MIFQRSWAKWTGFCLTSLLPVIFVASTPFTLMLLRTVARVAIREHSEDEHLMALVLMAGMAVFALLILGVTFTGWYVWGAGHRRLALALTGLATLACIGLLYMMPLMNKMV